MTRSTLLWYWSGSMPKKSKKSKRLRAAAALASLTLISAALAGASSASATGNPRPTTPPVMYPPGVTAGCTWTVHPLPLPTDWTAAGVVGDGVSRLAVSVVDTNRRKHAAVWTSSGRLVMLDPPDAGAGTDTDSQVDGIDTSGDVVLEALPRESGHSVAYLWRKGKFTALGNGAALYTRINRSGVIAGSMLVKGVERPTAWIAAQPRHSIDLGLAGMDSIIVRGITDTGLIWGNGATPGPGDGVGHAVAGTVKTGLSQLPGVDPVQESGFSPFDIGTAQANQLLGEGQLLSDPGAGVGPVLWTGVHHHASRPPAGFLLGSKYGLWTGVVPGVFYSDSVTVVSSGETWLLPLYTGTYRDSYSAGVSVIQDDGTLVGVSDPPDNYGTPVTWTCA